MAIIPPPHMRARKRFGQNFLVNDHIINSIVDSINPKEGDYLVEIGPGHAALTRPVFERAKALTAIELDRDLAERLRHDPFLKGLTLIESDALKVDFTKLPGAGKLRVFGNLPYNITSPLIFHLLSFPGIVDMHFMLQKEVVERLAAGPGNKDYGRLTVMAQFHAQVIPVLTVPPSAFIPPPKVMSAVVRLKPKPLTDEERALSPFLNKITTTAFAARRKTIRNSMSPLFEADELSAVGIDLQSRAEDLPLATYVELAKLLKSKRSLEDLIAQEEMQAQLKKDKRIAKLHGNEADSQTPCDDTSCACSADVCETDGANESCHADHSTASGSDRTVVCGAECTEASGADRTVVCGAECTEASGADRTIAPCDASAIDAAEDNSTEAMADTGKPLTAKERSILKKAQKKRARKFEDFDFNDINADL